VVLSSAKPLSADITVVVAANAEMREEEEGRKRPPTGRGPSNSGDRADAPASLMPPPPPLPSVPPPPPPPQPPAPSADTKRRTESWAAKYWSRSFKAPAPANSDNIINGDRVKTDASAKAKKRRRRDRRPS